MAGRAGRIDDTRCGGSVGGGIEGGNALSLERPEPIVGSDFRY